MSADTSGAEVYLAEFKKMPSTSGCQQLTSTTLSNTQYKDVRTLSVAASEADTALQSSPVMKIASMGSRCPSSYCTEVQPNQVLPALFRIINFEPHSMCNAS